MGRVSRVKNIHKKLTVDLWVLKLFCFPFLETIELLYTKKEEILRTSKPK